MNFKKIFQKFLESVNKIFGDRRLVQKAGVILGLNFITGMLNLLVRIIGISVDFWPVSMDAASRQTINNLFTTFIPLAVSILTLPLWIYKKGYMYKIADNIRKNNTRVNGGILLPEHEDRKDAMSLGSAFLSINYTLTIPFAVLSLIPFVLVMSMQGQMGLNSNPGVLMATLIGSFVVSILFSFVILFISSILVPILMNIYLKERKLREVFQFERVLHLIKKSWWLWLVLLLGSAAFRIVFWGVQVLLCCISPILSPFLQTLSMLLYSAGVGSLYWAMEE
jgi:hypothetical protein